MPNAMKQILRRLRAQRPIPRRRQFELRPVDTLETRILPTAIVTFTGAAMTIAGDTGVNAITVERIGTQVHVDANGGLITVAGTDVPDFFFNLNGAFNLTATFQNDTDVLVVGGIGAGLQLKSANIKLGDGPVNSVTFVETTLTGKLTIAGGDAVDVVTLVNTSVTGTTLLDLGWNTDVVTIVDGTYTGATTIKTGIGTGVVTIVGSTPSRAKFVGKLTVTGGDDIDVVTMISLDTKAMSIDTGDDTDVVVLSDILVNGGVSVKTGAGIDTVVALGIIQSGTGANLIDTGSATDTVVLQSSSLTGATTINLGSGTGNVLAIDDVAFNSTFAFNSQGTTDIIAIEQDTALTGQTTFVKAAKWNFGISSTMLLSAGDPATTTKFLSTVSFTGRSAFTTIFLDTTVSFAVGPVTKNVVIV
jgi:hypothetical protein